MILLECEETREIPFARVRSEVGMEPLRAAAELKAGQLPPLEEQQFDQLHGSYSHLRRGMHAVLDAVALRGAASTDHELLAALERVRQTRGPVRSSTSRPSSCRRRGGHGSESRHHPRDFQRLVFVATHGVIYEAKLAALHGPR